MTSSHVMNVGNVAHAAGAALGALVGAAVLARPPRRKPALAGVTALVAALIGAAIFARPWLTFSPTAADEYANAAYLALVADNPRLATRYSQIAVRQPDATADAWFNYGIACTRMGENAKALECYQAAARRNPENASYQKTAQQMSAFLHP